MITVVCQLFDVDAFLTWYFFLGNIGYGWWGHIMFWVYPTYRVLVLLRKYRPTRYPIVRKNSSGACLGGQV